MEFNVNIVFFKMAGFAYLLAFVMYLIYMITKSKPVGVVGTVLTIVGLFIHTVHLGYRWFESYQIGTDIGHIPISNLFESMSFAAWTVIILYLFFEWWYKNRAFGVVVTPVVLLAMAYVGFAPNVGKSIEPLVPALQSYWLHIHVITSFLGYAAFAVSFAVSLIYLVVTTGDRDAESAGSVYFKGWGGAMRSIFSLVNMFPYLPYDIYCIATRKKVREGAYIFWVTIISGIVSAIIMVLVRYSILLSPSLNFDIFRLSELQGGQLSTSYMAIGLTCLLGMSASLVLLTGGDKVKSRFLDDFNATPQMLDEISYKSIMIGFPLLTLGIITGAVWANEAWGTYWSWDPKETWSLITWFVYAAYLHARYTRGWSGKRAASISIFGFLAVIFTYLGVNLLLSGLHAYASAGGLSIKDLGLVVLILTFF